MLLALRAHGRTSADGGAATRAPLSPLVEPNQDGKQSSKEKGHAESAKNVEQQQSEDKGGNANPDERPVLVSVVNHLDLACHWGFDSHTTAGALK